MGDSCRAKDDAVDDCSAQIPAVRRRLGERVKSTGRRLRAKVFKDNEKKLIEGRALGRTRNQTYTEYVMGRGEGFVHMASSGTAALWMRAASGLEILTGLGLIVAPSLLARLLFGSDLNAAGQATGRISGLVMLCLAAGCWPRAAGAEAHALAPLMALSWLAAAFLIVTGLIGANVGMLLWPAAALHVILAVLLTRAWMESRRAAG